ncbi:hypothetical protein [Actibacterium atlanticum]|uniref:hypothetical protein n=1 Tax=Actibacterium atlanticum TaxID=1461693 RepID=UPI0012DE5CE2|nr:hypothetical protein [Actibacterium atlanticum]
MTEISALLDDLTTRKQDALKAELDHLASLANDKGMLAAEQICPALGIDLEGLEGVQDVILMLAIDHPQALERVGVLASLSQRYGGKSWSAFQFEDDGKPWALESEDARTAFVSDAIGILELPDHRKREADWYTSFRIHPITGEESEIVHATIYVEDRAASELAFGASEGLERQVFQRVMEVGIACDPTNRIVEICANGGKKMRDQYATVFSKHFAPDTPPPIEAPRREVLLETLRAHPSFVIEPSGGIDRVEVSALECFATGGGFARFERRGEDETVYQFLTRHFGEVSPLKTRGWTITGATLRIFLKAQEGKRARTLTITLRTPNTTTIPNKTETDRQFVMRLLERWKLVAPPPEDADVIEAA